MGWPDVVGLLVAYLDPIIDAEVTSRIPNPRPDRLVQIRRIGGAANPPVRDQPRIDVFCWAPGDPQAWQLAADTRTAIWALAGTQLPGSSDVIVYRIVEFMGPRQADDVSSAGVATTGTPRVWTTYDLTIRANDAIHAPAAPLDPVS